MHKRSIGLIIALITFTACTKVQDSDTCHVVDLAYEHKYGIPIPAQDWVDRGQSGKVTTILSNGVKVTRNYNSGILDGEVIYTFPHSEVTHKIEYYSQGNLQREFQQNISGVPVREVHYPSNSEQVITTWYETGSPRFIERYRNERLLTAEYFTTHNQLESKIDGGRGLRISRDEFAELISHDRFENGELALVTTFHPNGTPKEVTPYSHGFVQGTRRTYLSGGEPNSVEEWAGGVQQGMCSIYQNGEKYAEIPYVKGQKKGIEKRYKDGNHTVEEISWDNDQRHGPSHSYLGSRKTTEWYFQGKHVSKVNYDVMNALNFGL